MTKLIVYAAIYIWFCLCLMRIAEKTRTPNTWWAWIPVLNLVLITMIAKKPLWWIAFLLIPLVQMIVFVILWMAIADRRRKPSWVGILMIFPPVNLFAVGYLAYSR